MRIQTNILVTAISGDLANGILKVLRGTKANLYGTDIYDYPVGMDKVEKCFKICPAVNKQYLSELIRFCEETKITHIIPANEKELAIISNYRKEFEEKNISLVINSQEIIDVFLDKKRTYDFLKTIDGINVPDTYTFDEFCADGKLYIVKPKASCGSKYLRKVRSTDELLRGNMGNTPNDLIIQEYIDAENEEYTVGVFSDGEEIRTIIFRRKLKNGYTDFVELVSDENIVKDAVLIAKKTHLKGYINIQLRKYQGKNYIFEINPRISGSVVFRHMVGFDDVLWWVHMMDNKKIEDYRPKYRKFIGMRELSEKMVFSE